MVATQSGDFVNLRTRIDGCHFCPKSQPISSVEFELFVWDVWVVCVDIAADLIRRRLVTIDAV